jgi:hypothetical protein
MVGQGGGGASASLPLMGGSGSAGAGVCGPVVGDSGDVISGGTGRSSTSSQAASIRAIPKAAKPYCTLGFIPLQRAAPR